MFPNGALFGDMMHQNVLLGNDQFPQADAVSSTKGHEVLLVFGALLCAFVDHYRMYAKRIFRLPFDKLRTNGSRVLCFFAGRFFALPSKKRPAKGEEFSVCVRPTLLTF